MQYRRTDGTEITRLKWTAPTENTDGTPIDYPLSYNLYTDGVAVVSFPGSLNPDGTFGEDLANLPLSAGLQELTLTAFKQNDPTIESDPSNSLTIEGYRVPKAPAAFGAE